MDIHTQTFPMTFDWEPDPALVEQIATMIGLIDYSLDIEHLGEFKSYWVGQSMRYHTTYQWTQRYVQNLKRHRTAFRSKDTMIVGSQIVPKQAALHVDPNTNALLEKYGNNDNS
jgi:hypothetical protein